MTMLHYSMARETRHLPVRGGTPRENALRLLIIVRHHGTNVEHFIVSWQRARDRL